jgi:hypothetical protein
VHRLEVPDRDMNPGVGVRAAGLEQKHLDLRICAQTIGKYAACRAGANDDVVHLVFHEARLPNLLEQIVPYCLSINLEESGFGANQKTRTAVKMERNRRKWNQNRARRAGVPFDADTERQPEAPPPETLVPTKTQTWH